MASSRCTISDKIVFPDISNMGNKVFVSTGEVRQTVVVVGRSTVWSTWWVMLSGQRYVCRQDGGYERRRCDRMATPPDFRVGEVEAIPRRKQFVWILEMGAVCDGKYRTAS